MGTGDLLLGGNPVMDWHPIQRVVAILLRMLHAKETEISSGCLEIYGSCTSLLLTFLLFCFQALQEQNLYRQRHILMRW